ncbi:hypothetical protein [Adhaeretor mobilis]|uniref:Uncharacterized protein n=1 Tax=Adhaeretor mobilis TaxID=1930276 RepID=A0A517N1N0_9BACT|nr:hypothetical protein [Adhaeretor mobilis]QDT01037.1 hypothetical protein HG15A2_43790 [Adhaeretor mobilis]
MHFDTPKKLSLAALAMTLMASIAPAQRFVNTAQQLGTKQPESQEQAITHSFLACGKKTYILDGAGEETWSYPHATRDGYVLPSGNILLTLNRGKRFPGGAVVEITPEGKEAVLWRGTQAEVNSAQPTADETIVLTEAGPKPRLLEIDRTGKIIVEFPLACQAKNNHMQTRMTRKLADGTYLAPHLLDFAVFHYDAKGKVLSKLDTTVPGDTERKNHTWPFTAIRHGEGRTLVCCTNGNRVVDYDSEGQIVWELANDDLPGPWLQDPCGGQLLPNGNIVITSYAAGRKDPQSPKLFEVTPDKKIVWTHRDGLPVGIHHFQILDTNGVVLQGPPLK